MASVAPGRAGTKPRDTEVVRRPYWMPWGNNGQGRIKLLPADTAHTAMAVPKKGTPEPLYQAKGFIPLNHLPADHKAHARFKELCQAAVARANSEALPPPAWVPPSYRNTKAREQQNA